MCHALSTPAWNRSGSKLIFTYGPSVLRPGQSYTQGFSGGQRCLTPRASGIVIVSAAHPSNPPSWAFIAPRRGCSYTSAAFDSLGIAAFEACAPGLDGSPATDDLGPASVVQLDMRGKVEFRIALKIGADPGTVLSDPRTNEVLVTQDQTYEHQRHTRNWVWKLSGHKLELIASYPFDGQPVIAAQPWSQAPTHTKSLPLAPGPFETTAYRNVTVIPPSPSAPTPDPRPGLRPHHRVASVNCSSCQPPWRLRRTANNVAVAGQPHIHVAGAKRLN